MPGNQIPTPSFTGCVTWARVLSFIPPLYLHLLNEKNNGPAHVRNRGERPWHSHITVMYHIPTQQVLLTAINVINTSIHTGNINIECPSLSLLSSNRPQGL